MNSQTSRFMFSYVTGILPVILFCLGCSSGEQQETEKGQKSGSLPNVIYILADDAGYGDLSCYGQTKFKTPNIDRLAKEGLRFTSHYSGSTVCAPSRSVLLTGLHTGHTPIRANLEIFPEGQHPLPDSLFNLAKMFKSGGYTTGIFGKWGLGYPGSEGDPINQGFDEFYGYNCQRFGHHYYPYQLWENNTKIILEENNGTKKGQYAPSLIHEKALNFIEKNQANPFFLYIPTIIPHAELVAPEYKMAKYRGKFGEEVPYIGLEEGEDFRKGPYQSQKEPRAAFAAMMSLLDDQVGDIVQKVKDLGLADNTLIIFTSDNGPHREAGGDPDYFDGNGPFRGYKESLYEGGIRVPMIAYWLGKITPDTTNHISAFWDILPTMADLIGQQLPGKVDGVSFLPTLLNNGIQKQHEYLYWEFHEQGGIQAVRKGNLKAVRNNVLVDPDSEPELYDLSIDIEESINIASKYPEIIKEMDSIMTAASIPSPVFTFSSNTYLGE